MANIAVLSVIEQQYPECEPSYADDNYISLKDKEDKIYKHKMRGILCYIKIGKVMTGNKQQQNTTLRQYLSEINNYRNTAIARLQYLPCCLIDSWRVPITDTSEEDCTNLQTGMELYSVFEWSPNTLARTPNEIITTNPFSVETMVQITVGVHSMNQRGLYVKNIFLREILSSGWLEFPAIARYFEIERSNDFGNNFGSLGIVILRYICYKEQIVLNFSKIKRVYKLSRNGNISKLRSYVRKLLACEVDDSVSSNSDDDLLYRASMSELVVQCLQHRPSKEVIINILENTRLYRDACQAAYEFGLMIKSKEYYEELMFLPWYNRVVLDDGLDISERELEMFKEYSKEVFPVLALWQNYPRNNFLN